MPVDIGRAGVVRGDSKVRRAKDPPALGVAAPPVDITAGVLRLSVDREAVHGESSRLAVRAKARDVPPGLLTRSTERDPPVAVQRAPLERRRGRTSHHDRDRPGGTRKDAGQFHPVELALE